jgi:hypothetical protein
MSAVRFCNILWLVAVGFLVSGFSAHAQPFIPVENRSGRTVTVKITSPRGKVTEFRLRDNEKGSLNIAEDGDYQVEITIGRIFRSAQAPTNYNREYQKIQKANRENKNVIGNNKREVKLVVAEIVIKESDTYPDLPTFRRFGTRAGESSEIILYLDDGAPPAPEMERLLRLLQQPKQHLDPPSPRPSTNPF